MTASAFLSFITLSFIVCLAPGPSMFFVILQGLSKNRKKVAAAISGLIAANFIWILFCAFGVGALIQSSQTLFQILKMVGALYLIYLGVSELFSRKSSKRIEMPSPSIPARAVFIKGFLTSMTNPKALLFYMAFLPQFISGQMPYYQEILILWVSYLAVIAIVMSFYGFMATQIAHKLNNSFFNGILKKSMGICFVGFGISLLKYEQA